jgi:hypothetical protein
MMMMIIALRQSRFTKKAAGIGKYVIKGATDGSVPLSDQLHSLFCKPRAELLVAVGGALKPADFRGL